MTGFWMTLDANLIVLIKRLDFNVHRKIQIRLQNVVLILILLIFSQVVFLDLKLFKDMNLQRKPQKVWHMWSLLLQ